MNATSRSTNARPCARAANSIRATLAFECPPFLDQMECQPKWLPKNHRFWIARCRRYRRSMQTESRTIQRRRHVISMATSTIWPDSQRWHGKLKQYISFSIQFYAYAKLFPPNLPISLCSTLQRPFKNHLPPTGKAIPPPKISDTYQSKASLTSPKPAPLNGSNGPNGPNGTISPPPPPMTVQVPLPNVPVSQPSLSESPPLPPPPIIPNEPQTQSQTQTSNNNPNDESNYAVTEL